MRRSGLLAFGVALMLVGRVAPAFADDLDDYLDRAADAEYAGSRVVVTVWDGRSYAEMTEIEHSGHMVMLGSSGSESIYVEGKVVPQDGAGIAVTSWAAPVADDKYSVGTTRDLTRLGRQAHEVSILEGGEVRARIVFDSTTWAPLTTEIYDGGGELFRIASMTNFDPHPRRVYAGEADDGRDYDLVVSVDETSLPRIAGGYARVDVYAGTDGVVQTFYADGLFSFSVFEVMPRQVQARFEGADTMRIAGADYLVIVRPAEVWVSWVHGSAAYVLVGDLPPDHLRAVLADLPRPKRPGLLERIFSFWR